MAHSTLPTARSITRPQFDHILSLYPGLLSSFYQTKLKKASKTELTEALRTDSWRYEVLPGSFIAHDIDATSPAARKPRHSLTLGSLQKLVEWKITHQTYRPFLPAQVRKNDADAVLAVSSATLQILRQPDSGSGLNSDSAPNRNVSLETVKEALTKITELKGVGPATGTLVLSVFEPDAIPFFEDELFSWLSAGPSEAQGTGKGKLKYNVAEYVTLFEQFQFLRARLVNGSVGSKSVTASEVEKVAFVLGHWDLVREDDKKVVLQMSADAPDLNILDNGQNMEAGKPDMQLLTEADQDLVKDKVADDSATTDFVQHAKRKAIDGTKRASGSGTSLKKHSLISTSGTSPTSSALRRSKRAKR